MNGFLASVRPNIWLHAASRSSRFASTVAAATSTVWRWLGRLLAAFNLALRVTGVGFAFFPAMLPSLSSTGSSGTASTQPIWGRLRDSAEIEAQHFRGSPTR